MSNTSKIEWTDATWNPIVGCTHVSEGCEHCYAAREASGRLAHLPAYKGLAVDGHFTGEVRILEDRLDQPFRWRKPRMVFVNSMSDLFHADVPTEFIERVFVVMARNPRHTFQVLTKRPGRMASVLNEPGTRNFIVNRAASENVEEHRRRYGGDGVPLHHLPKWPLDNVWLGTSVENQKWADVRIPQLLRTPAEVRFLSCEPLLGPVDLDYYIGPSHHAGLLHWVIVGGESGAGSRPMYPAWPKAILRQCSISNIPYFFKQWGNWVPVKMGGGDAEPTWVKPDGSIGDSNELNGFSYPEDWEPMVRIGRKNMDTLDGVGYHMMP